MEALQRTTFAPGDVERLDVGMGSTEPDAHQQQFKRIPGALGNHFDPAVRQVLHVAADRQVAGTPLDVLAHADTLDLTRHQHSHAFLVTHAHHTTNPPCARRVSLMRPGDNLRCDRSPHREKRSGASGMRLRWLLVALLVVGLILLLWLLPRSALLLQPVFSSLQRQVETAGYELTAQRVSGNLLTGLTLEGATLSGPGLRLSGQYVSVTYSLLSLLSGPLMIDAELAGVSGRVEAGNIEPGQTGSINLPVSLGDLSLS